MENLLLYAVLLFLAFMATEGTVEYVLGTLFDKIAANQKGAGPGRRIAIQRGTGGFPTERSSSPTA